MPTFPPEIDESTLPCERAVVVDGLVESRIAYRADVDRVIDLHLGKDRGGQAAHRLHRSAIKMYTVNRHARQYSGRFSVVALLARLWRPF
jgi:hypothetical protein